MARSKELEELLAQARKPVNVGSEKAPQPVNNSGGKGFKHLLGTVGSFFVETDNSTVPETLPEPVEEEISFSGIDLGEDLSQTSFEDIYNQAGITPVECTIEDLATLLQKPEIATQPPAMKAQFIDFALSAKGQTPRMPIDDAAVKDRALDAYQRMLNDRAASTEVDNEARIVALQKEVEDFLKLKQNEIDQLRQDSAEKTRQAATFQQRRMAEEKRLSDLISPFLKGEVNPVSVGNTP